VIVVVVVVVSVLVLVVGGAIMEGFVGVVFIKALELVVVVVLGSVARLDVSVRLDAAVAL
jgi:hypothetical protein